MLSTTTRPLFTTPSLTRLKLHRRTSLSTTTTTIKMSTTSTTVEHIVLFNVKPNTDPALTSTMLSGLNSLSSLDMVLHLSAAPLHRSLSRSFPFTHLLHSRYASQPDLANYSAHQAHLSVVRSSVLPICDDIMAVDWVSQQPQPNPPPPGSALRVQFVKLKDGVGEKEKGEVYDVIAGLKDKVNGIQQLSFGDNFSPARAKGFSVASLAVFNGVEELDAAVNDVEIGKEKDKVRDYIDDLIIVDYVVPSSAQSASL